jgi:hypothetical protein
MTEGDNLIEDYFMPIRVGGKLAVQNAKGISIIGINYIARDCVSWMRRWFPFPIEHWSE